MEDNKQNINDSNIQDKASSFKNQLGGEKNFDEEKFRTDTETMKNNNDSSLYSLDAESYRKKDDNYGNSDGLCFNGFFKDGVHTAVGPNGKIIKSKDFADFSRQLAAEYVSDAKIKGKDPHCDFETSDKDPQKKEIFAREFIKSGVIVSGDVPNNPKFWNDFKQEYLTNPENNLEQWNKLTSKVPSEYMEQGQSKTAKSASKRSLVTNLRKGINPNLTQRTTPTPQRQITANQTDMQQFLNKKTHERG